MGKFSFFKIEEDPLKKLVRTQKIDRRNNGKNSNHFSEELLGSTKDFPQ